MHIFRRGSNGRDDRYEARHIGIVKKAEKPSYWKGGKDDGLGQGREQRCGGSLPFVETQQASQGGGKRQQREQDGVPEDGSHALEQKDAMEQQAHDISDALG